MSDLRTYLKEYVDTINNILDTNENDQAIIEAAEREWIRKDHRRLVFTASNDYRFPTPPPKKAGGSDIHSPNELPPQTSPPVNN
ncbi:MAG: hypothetical protein DRR08_08960 [Candidatus Parabeggiatoa sp. nov. 2]|nr:MAG: hypothetical protein B6247_11290 [Beggiatoa sp. 4572_84]RKZ61333.1 MAG: hypothetical protein DRR08_08960 [Gammaproteobacteria bacterium]